MVDTAASADSKEKKKDDAKPAPGWTIAPPGFEMRLRMSGLLWPEAADRLANAAYVTRESVGAGQLILFASDPTFRGAALGTSRIFANAITLGTRHGRQRADQAQGELKASSDGSGSGADRLIENSVCFSSLTMRLLTLSKSSAGMSLSTSGGI
jgi:hypothetical protein